MSDCEPFSYEWERELLRMRKSDLVNYIRDILRDRRAATGEKSSVVGNAAKMREALELASRVIHGAIAADILKGDDAQAAFFACRDALSAPPRNCDVGTANEQNERFYKFCHARAYCKGCPLFEGRNCEFAWAQLPYEEGGAK